jgi:hypothetical protein
MRREPMMPMVHSHGMITVTTNHQHHHAGTYRVHPFPGMKPPPRHFPLVYPARIPGDTARHTDSDSDLRVLSPPPRHGCRAAGGLSR